MNNETNEAARALEQQRAELTRIGAQLAELAHEKAAAADDPEKFGAVVAKQREAEIAHERAALLVRRAEGAVQAAEEAARAEQRAAEEAELAALERELHEAVGGIQTGADAFAQAIRAAWEAKRAVDAQTAHASDIQARARALGERLGSTLELERRDLGKYARAAALVVLEQHRDHATELGDWLTVYPTSDRLLGEVQRSLGMWRHIGDAPYPELEQLADMLSYRAERWHARAVTDEARTLAVRKAEEERLHAEVLGAAPAAPERKQIETVDEVRPGARAVASQLARRTHLVKRSARASE